MARINMTASEPLKVIHLFEEMFGLNLEPLKKMLNGVMLNGTITITKKLAEPEEKIIVQVTVDPDTPTK